MNYEGALSSSSRNCRSNCRQRWRFAGRFGGSWSVIVFRWLTFDKSPGAELLDGLIRRRRPSAAKSQPKGASPVCASACGVQRLDAALFFEYSRAIEHAATFNRPRPFEREAASSRSTPQQSLHIGAILGDCTGKIKRSGIHEPHPVVEGAWRCKRSIF